MNEGRLRTRAIAGLVVLAMSGCLPHVDDTRIYDERPIGSARSAEERRQPDPDITSSVSDNTVRITAMQRTECRTTTTTSVEREDGVGHSLHNGTLAQSINLALAGALVAGGVAIYAAADSGSCTTTPSSTASNPHPSAVPCTGEQRQTQTTQVRGLGVLTATAAVLPLGAFVWNIFRAKDETKVEPIPPSVVATEWKTCSTRPVANARVTIEAGGVVIRGQTDERGSATLDVGSIANATTNPQAGVIKIAAGESTITSGVSLRDTAANAAWLSRQESDAANRAVAQVAEAPIQPAPNADAQPMASPGVVPVSSLSASVSPGSQSGADAWAQARREDVEAEGTALDQVEADMALVERKKTWSADDIERLARCARTMTSMMDSTRGPNNARVAAVMNRLTPMMKRAMALNESRRKELEAEDARSEAEARKQLLPTCIQCCLTSYVGATRDHCQASCTANPRTYVGVNSPELVRQYGGSVLFCDPPR